MTSGTRLRWAILGTGDFASSVAIPAMAHCKNAVAAGVASRSHNKARETALRLGIPKYYASYASALADPEIDVIYITLPNHLHFEWTLRSIQAGKHVLCEKPLTLTVKECIELIEARKRTGVTVGEAFMVRHHPQWKRILQLAETSIGKIRSVSSSFSFFVENGDDVRLRSEFGGGALNDLGCYLVLISRLLFKSEPTSVACSMGLHGLHNVDMSTAGILTFPQGHSVFSCGLASSFFQGVQIIGDSGWVLVETPFSVGENDIAEIRIKSTDHPERVTIESYLGVNQYTLQADDFSAAISSGTQPGMMLEDSLNNITVMDALRLSARTGKAAGL